MKRFFMITVAVLLTLSLISCSGTKQNKKNIIGTWRIIDSNGVEGALTVTFNEDGTYSYGFNSSLISDAAGDFSFDAFVNSSIIGDIAKKTGLSALLKSDTVKNLVEKLHDVAKLTYNIDNGKKMTVGISLLFGVINHDSSIEYSLNGDKLTFDGVNYIRIKD